MKKNLIIVFVFLAIALNIGTVIYSISLQHSLLDKINKLKYSIVSNKTANISEKDLKDYIFNLNYYKDISNATLINQSGLSIIFTVIVLLLTITTGFIINHNLDEKFEKNHLSLENYNKAISKDLTMLIRNHIGAGKVGYADIDKEFNRMCTAINNYKDLKFIDLENLKEIYQDDIEEISRYLIGKIMNINNENDNLKYFFEINSEEDRKNIINKIKQNYSKRVEDYLKQQWRYATPEKKEQLKTNLKVFLDLVQK